VQNEIEAPESRIGQAGQVLDNELRRRSSPYVLLGCLPALFVCCGTHLPPFAPCVLTVASRSQGHLNYDINTVVQSGHQRPYGLCQRLLDLRRIAVFAAFPSYRLARLCRFAALAASALL
jgi:hypothetical protein